MTIASVGTLGTGASSTSNSSYSLTTATNTLSAGNFAILVNVTDNTSTTDGNNNEHTSVSGGTGNWTKLGEYTNSPTGAAADGSTVSLWLFEATGTVNTGTSITMNYASSRTDKASAFWKFTKLSGKGIRLDTEPGTNPITSEVNGAVGFGSSAFSGLSSKSRLYLRGCGKEANSTTALTVSTSFTEITGTRSRNNSAAQIVRGEFRINTSTGETSNPTLAVTGDTAGLFVALIEVDPAPTDGAVAYSGNAPTVSVGKLITPSDGFVQLTTPASTGTTITPTVGSVAYTGNAPTLTLPQIIAPTTGTVAYTGAASRLAYSITPTVGSVTYSGNAPRLALTIPPAAGTVTLTGAAPTVTVSSNVAIAPTTGSVAYTGNAPALNLTIPPAAGTVILTGYAPTVTVSSAAAITPPTGTVSYTGVGPALNLTIVPQAGVVRLTSTDFTVQAANGTIALTGYAPTVISPITIQPAAGTLTLTGSAPTVTSGASRTITPTTGDLTLTGYVSRQLYTIPAPATGTLTLTGSAPALAVSKTIQPTSGSMAYAGNAPTVTVSGTGSSVITPTSGSVTLTGYVVEQTYTLPSPDAALLALTGYAATVTRTAGATIQPSAGTVTFTGSAPSLAYRLTPQIGTVSLTGYAPTVTITAAGTISPASGILTLDGNAPTVTTSASQTIQPPSGDLFLTGQGPSLGLAISPATGSVVIIGNSTSLGLTIVPTDGLITLSGQAPTLIETNRTITPAAGGISISGLQPMVTAPPQIPERDTHGGAGYPVDWQGKRRKARLEERPNLHLRAILDDVVRELYGDLTEADVPAEVQKKAAKLVKPYAEKKAKKLAVPPESAVDWTALEKDAARVRQIVALWREEETRREIDDEDEFMLLVD